MDYLLKVVALVVTASAIALIHLLGRARARKAWPPANLPPGSMGLPVIGQTFGFLRAFRGNSDDRWIRDRIHRYGPVSKLSLFGTPTVILAGPAGNKFLFFSSMLRVRQLRSVTRLLGDRSLPDLHGDDHGRMRGAVLEFLQPDMLKQYVGRIDAEVRRHLEENWLGLTTVTVLPLIKRLTFSIIAALLFGLEAGDARDALADDLGRMLEGVLAIPVNLPFTAFSRSLRSSQRARRLIEGITRDKKDNLRQGKASPSNDLITRLLSLTDDHGGQLVSDEEIVDNGLHAMLAGHDTITVLMTFMIRQLATDPATLSAMAQEHQEIAKNKADGEPLSWEDLSKMKLTWRVAQETLRIVPPLAAIFRTAHEDMEFDGYRIPKGWQVLLSPSVTHMDPSIFQEPAKFDPSRFENQSSMPRCSFVPFGAGLRVCPAIEFTRMEILVTMHYLVSHFKWKLCCKDNTFVRNPFPSPQHGLPIQLEHRTSPFE